MSQFDPATVTVTPGHCVPLYISLSICTIEVKTDAAQTVLNVLDVLVIDMRRNQRE